MSKLLFMNLENVSALIIALDLLGIVTLVRNLRIITDSRIQSNISNIQVSIADRFHYMS